MTPQDILYPLGKALEYTFEMGLVPIADVFNWVAIAAAPIGIAIWVRMQLKYTAEAERQGTIN